MTVLIPLVPTSGDEQWRNAQRVVEAGAGRMLSGPDVTPDALCGVLTELLQDPGLRARMSERAASLGQPEAATALARLLIRQASVTGSAAG